MPSRTGMGLLCWTALETIWSCSANTFCGREMFNLITPDQYGKNAERNIAHIQLPIVRMKKQQYL